jgi:flavin-dependent dehydrogenase
MEPINTEILVLGAGPGGYTAAFYAADKGKKVTLVEQNKRLGGICLNVGCIPQRRSSMPPIFLSSRLTRRSVASSSVRPRLISTSYGTGKRGSWKNSAKASRVSLNTGACK